ncbi:MAG: zinc-binding alcohol dehydrogenase family protein [Phyllobacteriaceae bacterium]|nr:zinc-binding alcohol dehydrogenase family protein [Phyllobacteriaceae bacterium]
MKAIAITFPPHAGDQAVLGDIIAPDPVPAGRDLLVRVRAISVNPVDAKVRASAKAPGSVGRILGWDAAGIVEATGADCTLFKPGDRVFYAGAIGRPGSNAELQLVDERIVGRAPANLTDAEAAAMPLTSITAWEALFDRLDVAHPPASGANAILVIGGAGGVASMAIQLAKALTDLTVIGTASRPETTQWVMSMGADHVLDHGKSLAGECARLGIGAPAFVLSTTQTDRHFDGIAELIAPQGRFALIDDTGPIDVRLLKRKSVSLHWELMFTRSLFETPDLTKQHDLLGKVAELVESGRIRSTISEHFGMITAENLLKAHAMVESGRARGKIVLEGFPG